MGKEKKPPVAKTIRINRGKNISKRKREELEEDLLTESISELESDSESEVELTDEMSEENISKKKSGKKYSRIDNSISTVSKAGMSVYEEQLPENYRYSFLKIENFAKEYDYSVPFHGAKQTAWSGSGFILKYKGEKFIVTNAHVGTSASHIKIRFSKESVKYPAEVIQLDHDCDIAILKVTKNAKEFWKKAKCLEIFDHDLVKGLKVLVCGFPMMGSELSIKDGNVNRIEVGPYVNGDAELLYAQVSATINSGNSGGAVLCNGKLIGVAFQSCSGYVEGINEIIPAKGVLDHFLDDYLAPGPYKGFPYDLFDFQELENDYQRKIYGMSDEETGVRVTKIDMFSSANGPLKVGDILTSIDGKAVNSDGTVDMDGSERIPLDYMFSKRHINEISNLSIIRGGERLNIELPLLNKARMSKLIPPEEKGVKPEFLVVDGVVFVPLTQNVLEELNIDGEDLLLQAPKQQLQQQAVIILDVRISDLTEGYIGFRGQMVKEVNGKKIFNMTELALAIDSNSSEYHRILTTSMQEMILPNLDVNEHKKLLRKQLEIPVDRSNNLRPEILSQEIAYKPGEPEYWVTENNIPDAPKPVSPISVFPAAKDLTFMKQVSDEKLFAAAKLAAEELANNSESENDLSEELAQKRQERQAKAKLLAKS